MIELDASGWRLLVEPDAGGAIRALEWRCRPVLRPTDPTVSDVAQSSCFALVPFANRIAHGSFVFEGHPYSLRLNRQNEPHALHGLGWQTPWEIEFFGAGRVRLSLQHRGDAAWPWSFHARQDMRMTSDGFAIRLSLRNTSPISMPAGLGLHPAFPLTSGSALTMKTASVWLTDEGKLPTVEAPADFFGDWSLGSKLAGNDLIDNCYTGWNGRAIVSSDDIHVTMTTSGTPFVHLYRPPGQQLVCIEPVSHPPDALNRDESLSLAPGARCEIGMVLRAAIR